MSCGSDGRRLAYLDFELLLRACFGNELRDLTAHSRPDLIRVPEVNPRIHASIDYFLNRFAESAPAASNTGLRDNDWHAGIVFKFRSEDLCHGAAVCRVS